MAGPSHTFWTLSLSVCSPQTHLELQSTDTFLLLQLTCSCGHSQEPQPFSGVSPKTLSFRHTSLTVGFWNFQLLVSSASLFFPLSLSTWQLPWRAYCSGMAQAIWVWHGKCDRKGGEVQHYPWLSEGFLCPFGRKHDHNTFQLTSIELDNLRRSGASLQYHIKAFALKFSKAWYLKQNSALFCPQSSATSASLSICIQSIKETLVHQHVHEFLVSWDSAFWQLSLGRHMFLPFPSVQECLFISLKTSMVRSFLLFLHISWIAS